MKAKCCECGKTTRNWYMWTGNPGDQDAQRICGDCKKKHRQ